MSIKTLYNENDSFSRDARLSKVLWLAKGSLEKECNILDIGCGDGKIAGELVKMGHKVAGIDISEKAIAEAKIKGVDARVSQIEEFETDKKYDLVIMTDILEHLFEPLEVLKKSKGWLTEDGKIVMNFPNHFDLRNRFRLFLGHSAVHWDHKELKPWEYQHIRFLTLNEIRKMVELAGFFVEKEQFNFMGGGLIPVKLTPAFVRSFLVKRWPALFSGKFGFLLSQKKDTKVSRKFFPKTLRGM